MLAAQDSSHVSRRGRLLSLHACAAAALAVGLAACSPDSVDQQEPANTPTPDQTATRTTSVDPSPAPTETADPTTSSEPTPSPTPSPSSPAAEDPPTWDNVPTLEMMFPEEIPGVQQLAEREGMAEEAVGLCDPGTYGDPGTVLVREYGTDPEFPSVAIVLGYPDAESASAGYDMIADAARDCEELMADAGWDETYAEAAEGLPFDESAVDAEPTRAEYFFGRAVKEDERLGVFNDTLVLQAGNRVAWLVTTFEGIDNNCAVAEDDVVPQCAFARSLPDVADRLVQ